MTSVFPKAPIKIGVMGRGELISLVNRFPGTTNEGATRIHLRYHATARNINFVEKTGAARGI
jgi:hypothetical protein